MCTEALLLLLSFACLSGPITVDPQGSGLDPLDVCCNVLIPFISGCARVCSSKTDVGGCLCLREEWVDLIYTKLISQQVRADTCLINLLLLTFSAFFGFFHLCFTCFLAGGYIICSFTSSVALLTFMYSFLSKNAQIYQFITCFNHPDSMIKQLPFFSAID